MTPDETALIAVAPNHRCPDGRISLAGCAKELKKEAPYWSFGYCINLARSLKVRDLWPFGEPGEETPKREAGREARAAKRDARKANRKADTTKQRSHHCASLAPNRVTHHEAERRRTKGLEGVCQEVVEPTFRLESAAAMARKICPSHRRIAP